VPATFRTALAGLRNPGIVVFPKIGMPVLEGSGIDRFDAIAAGLDRIEQTEAQERLARHIFATAQELLFDPEGRVTLPERLALHAQITEMAVFVGRGPTFEIWEPGRYAQHEAEEREQVRQEGARLAPPDLSAPRRLQ
jgi:MraZ protein